ncbi:MAG: TIGR00282 family metallophosphoesterase [Clostridia bacterium]|nr:TIGR00282 family metallophosphoesterase [Clostridia bacterium]
MKILIIGDIVGTSGVRKVKEILSRTIQQEKIDFVIANGENSSDGMGITSKIFKELQTAGVNIITMGNHTWGKKDIFNIINNKNLLRPANYPKNVLGNGYGIYECKGKRIAVINLIGRVDMNILSENPFIVVEDIINKIRDKSDIIIVDFHAEATAEKIAMGYFLDGKVTCVFGTHTHVITADETILEKGTAYITDIGMTGPKKSVIGMDIEASIKRFLTTMPERYKVSTDEEITCNGCILTLNSESCRAEKITRIKL